MPDPNECSFCEDALGPDATRMAFLSGPLAGERPRIAACPECAGVIAKALTHGFPDPDLPGEWARTPPEPPERPINGYLAAPASPFPDFRPGPPARPRRVVFS